MERRAIAFRERHGIADIPFAVVGGVYDLRALDNITAIIQVTREVEAITGESIVLIVIDTISRALCGGDENSPKDMGAIVAATSRLRHETNAHVLWVHHMPQYGAKTKGPRSIARGNGHDRSRREDRLAAHSHGR